MFACEACPPRGLGDMSPRKCMYPEIDSGELALYHNTSSKIMLVLALVTEN